MKSSAYPMGRLRFVEVLLFILSPTPFVMVVWMEGLLRRGVVGQFDAAVRLRGANPQGFVPAGGKADGLAFWRDAQEVNFLMGGVLFLSLGVGVLLLFAGVLVRSTRKQLASVAVLGEK